MFLMPKGKPLVENFPIAKLQLPEALDKLKNGRLTGSAIFAFPTADCVLIYDEGKLISALLHRDTSELKDADALRALVELMVFGNSGSFTVFSYSKGVKKAILALVRGDKIIDKQELKQIDFKALLERIMSEHMTATLRIYTDQRVGMILYQDGATVGFFHDAAHTIETTGGEVQHIAELPGACVDLRVLKGGEELTLDLTGQQNIQSLWESATGDVFASIGPVSTPPPQSVPVAPPPTSTANSADIESVIIAIANSSLGKLGKTIVEKELVNAGGIKSLKDNNKLSEFLNAVEKSSKLLASINKIKEMCEAISAEAAKL